MEPYKCKLGGVIYENPTKEIILSCGYDHDAVERISNKITNHYINMVPQEAKWRDDEIKRTDFIFLPDTKFTPEQLEVMKEYRQALRDYPRQCEIPYVRPIKPSFFK